MKVFNYGAESQAFASLNVISQMPNYSFGGMNVRYAHNLWLDCAIVTGFFPFALLLIITIFHMLRVAKVILNKTYMLKTRAFFLCLHSLYLLFFYGVCFRGNSDDIPTLLFVVKYALSV